MVQIKKGISGSTLKWIAVITMLMDHIGASLLERSGNLPQLDVILRSVGRVAFPLFCFLLVEGFYHTHSVEKYAMRLLIFALVSEIPFDMAFNDTFFFALDNNVFWTLLIGLMMIWGIHALDDRWEKKKEKEDREEACPNLTHEQLIDFRDERRLETDNLLRSIEVVLLVLLAMIVAQVSNTDYGACGVATIGVFYFLYSHRVTAVVIVVLMLTMTVSSSEIFSIAILPLLYFYNGTRGHQNRYFFYAFYPVHLLILGILGIFMGLGI